MAAEEDARRADGQPAPDIAWPVATMDFEASSLTAEGYPIEVGAAVWHGPGHPVRSWSTLIRPTAAWLEDGHWDPRSAQVHGIAQRELATGLAPRDVATALNGLLRGSQVACDGFRFLIRNVSDLN